MDYPKALVPSDWDKKKGLLAKAHATGIGDALKALQRTHEAVDWTQCNPLLWAKKHSTADAYEKALDDLLKQVDGKLKALKQQADKVETLADKWSVTFAKDKLVPKSATQAAKDVAAAAGNLGKAIKPWQDTLEKQANAVLARLPSPGSDDEPDDKLLSPDFLKATLVRCRNNPDLIANFAYCPPIKDGTAAFVAHVKIPAKRLLAKLKEATGASQGTFGTLRIQDGEMLLTLNKAVSGLAKRIRELVQDTGLRFKAYRLSDESGNEVDNERDAQEGSTLEQVETELKGLSTKVQEALKRDPTLKAALLAAVGGVQNAIKREDSAGALASLKQLKVLVLPSRQDQPGTPPTVSSKATLNQQISYEHQKKQLAPRIKGALVRPAVTAAVKALFEQAETWARQASFGQAIDGLTTLEHKLEEIDKADQRFQSQAKQVLSVTDDFAKQVSPKNQERLRKLRELALAKAQAGDFEAAHQALADLTRLASAIKSESTPGTAPDDGSEQAAGEFLNQMNEEADWLRQASLVEELRTKLADLKDWKDSRHGPWQQVFGAMEESARKGDFAKAQEQLANVSPQVLQRHLDRKVWEDLDSQRKVMPKAIEDLDSLGATEVAVLRYELAFAMSLASQDKFADAAKKLKLLHSSSTKLLDKYLKNPELQRWASKDTDYLKAKGLLDSAKRALGKIAPAPSPTVIAAHQQKLDAVDEHVGKGQYGDACTKLEQWLPEIQALYDTTVILIRHRNAINATTDRKHAADCLTATPPLKDKVEAYKAAYSAMDKANTLARASELDALRETALQRMGELLGAYEKLSDTERGTQRSADKAKFMLFRDRQLAPIRKVVQAKTFTALTSEMATQLKQFADDLEAMRALVKKSKYQEALLAAQELVKLGAALQQARKDAGRSGESFNKRWKPLTQRIEGLKQRIGTQGTSPTKEQAAFSQALERMDELRAAKPVDFEACLGHLGKTLEPALRTALAQQAEQTLAEIDQADDTAKAETLIKGKQAWEIESLPPEQQAKLLRNLRKGWGKLPSDDKRAAQRKMYANMHLDEEFVAYDKEQRTKIAEAFKGDDELRTAQTGWNTLPWSDRLRQLQRVANEQCKAYDFGPPPVVKLVDLGGNPSSVTNGYFSPATKCIVINTNPHSSANDFERAVDLIIHENSHYFQDQLALGMIDAQTRDPRLVKQTELFKLNREPGGYVTSGEAPDAHAVYQQQPLEEHAHLAGPKAAKAIIKAL